MKKINPEIFVQDELKFCEERFEKDENGHFIYKSKHDRMNLPFVLSEYRDWLIENNLMRNKDGNEL